jgi:hypothetical protein
LPLVGVPARKKKKSPGIRRGSNDKFLEGDCVRFGGGTLGGRGRFRLGLAAIELAHGIGANRPRGNLRSLGLLTFAIGPLICRVDEAAFDEHVSL